MAEINGYRVEYREHGKSSWFDLYTIEEGTQGKWIASVAVCGKVTDEQSAIAFFEENRQPEKQEPLTTHRDDIGIIKNTEIKMMRVEETYTVREIKETRSGYKIALVGKGGEVVAFFQPLGNDVYKIVKIAKDTPQNIHFFWKIKGSTVERVEMEGK